MAILTAAIGTAPAGAASPLAFSKSGPVSPIGGGEPRVAVLVTGTRLATFQGGDIVSRSTDGINWKTILPGGHTGTGFSPTNLTGACNELFDGGDVDIAAGPDGTAYVSSLSFNTPDGVGVAIISSHDDGQHWTVVNCHAGEAAADRPWIAAGPGAGDLYLFQKDLHLEEPVVRASHDGGKTFGPISPVLTDPRLANFPVQVSPGNFAVAPDGTVYAPFTIPAAAPAGDVTSAAAPQSRVIVGIGHEDPVTHLLTFVDRQVTPLVEDGSSTNAAYIFPSLAVDTAGNPVVAWSQAATYKGPYDVYFSSCASACSDLLSEANPLSVTWSSPVRVTSAGNNVFPAVAAGSPGHLALAWYGTSYSGDTTGGPGAGTLGQDSPADWRTYVGTTIDWLAGSAAKPHFQVADASGHVIHHGSVCLGGTFCNLSGAPGFGVVGNGNRTLADNFGIAIDRAGGVETTWTDVSTRDKAGNPQGLVFAACQVSGSSMIAGRGPLNGCGSNAAASPAERATQAPVAAPGSQLPNTSAPPADFLLVLMAAAAAVIVAGAQRRRVRNRR